MQITSTHTLIFYLGLHLEQDQPAHFRGTLRRIHLLEDGKQFLRPTAAPIRYLQLCLRGAWVHKPDAALLPSQPRFVRDKGKEGNDTDEPGSRGFDADWSL